MPQQLQALRFVLNKVADTSLYKFHFNFSRKVFILILISALITSQGDFATTKRTVKGVASLLGIHRESRLRYCFILVWKASEFGLGRALRRTSPQTASMAILCYIPITYMLGYGSTVSALISWYHFLETQGFSFHPPRRQKLSIFGQTSLKWQWTYPFLTAITYCITIHQTAKRFVWPYILEKHPLSNVVLHGSQPNWLLLFILFPLMIFALWNFFEITSSSLKCGKARNQCKTIYTWLNTPRQLLFKRLVVLAVVCIALTLLQLPSR